MHTRQQFEAALKTEAHLLFMSAQTRDLRNWYLLAASCLRSAHSSLASGEIASAIAPDYARADTLGGQLAGGLPICVPDKSTVRPFY
jgi:hypothetical protein